MPESGFSYNAAETTLPDAPQHSPKMTTAPMAAPARRLRREPAICPTDDDSIVPKKHPERQKLNKSSREYIIKTGVAGGFAGCAVSTMMFSVIF